MQNKPENPNFKQDLQDLYNVKRPNPINTNNDFDPYSQVSPVNDVVDTTQTSYYQNDLGDEELYQSAEEETPIYTEAKPEKRSGRLFYIVTGIISLILLLIIGILGYLIYNSSQDNQNNTVLNSSPSSSTVTQEPQVVSSSSSSSSTPETLFTDANGVSPAEASRINNERVISTQYLETYFANYVENGVCTDDTVCAEETDFDTDGMSNILEYNYQTDPTSNDTDNDGISDGDEFIYNTNPKESDSDGDKIDDLNEIIACSDPSLKTFTPVKLLQTGIKRINDTVASRGLSTVTIDSLVDGGATSADLKLGLISKNCVSSNIVFGS